MGALSFLHVTASNLEFSSCSISVSTTARAPSHTSSYPAIFLYLAICVSIFPSPAPSAFSNGHHCILDLPLFIKFLSVHPSPAPVVFFYGYHGTQRWEPQQADILCLTPSQSEFSSCSKPVSITTAGIKLPALADSKFPAPSMCISMYLIHLLSPSYLLPTYLANAYSILHLPLLVNSPLYSSIPCSSGIFLWPSLRRKLSGRLPEPLLATYVSTQEKLHRPFSISSPLYSSTPCSSCISMPITAEKIKNPPSKLKSSSCRIPGSISSWSISVSIMTRASSSISYLSIFLFDQLSLFIHPLLHLYSSIAIIGQKVLRQTSWTSVGGLRISSLSSNIFLSISLTGHLTLKKRT